MIKKIEQEVESSPILIGGRIMTTEGLDDETEAGPSNPQPYPPSTPKLGFQYFDEKLCYAPSRQSKKPKIELCSTVLPVLESPMCPPEHEKGPFQDTPMTYPTSSTFHASYHIQNVRPYADLSNQRCLSCMVCDTSKEEIKKQKTDWYMERSTPHSEPDYITTLRRQAYENRLNAGSLLFLAPAVLQAAACDGTKITITTTGQESVPGTLPIFQKKTQVIKTFVLFLYRQSDVIIYFHFCFLIYNN